MIPNFTPCSEAAVAACPQLFNDLNSLLGVAYTAVQEAVGDTPCGENLSSSVLLDPVSIGPGNHVYVIPSGISVKRAKNAVAALPMLTRLSVSAVVVVVLEGYPVAEIVDDRVWLPTPEELTEASKYVTSVGWCVYCAMVDAMVAGNLLESIDAFGQVEIGEGSFSDGGAGQATAQFRVTWTY